PWPKPSFPIPCVLTGSGAVTGPGTVTRTGVTCATYIVSTVKLQLLVRQGRFSILNSCVLWAFRVTEERLAKKDAGTLRCGIRKGFFPLHESADVEVIITPDRSMQVFLIAAVIPALGARDHTEGGCFTLSVTGRRDPSCATITHFLFFVLPSAPSLPPSRLAISHYCGVLCSPCLLFFFISSCWCFPCPPCLPV
uniref:Uncharacterized protein n=1 Tax=Serinus canaria TaxID=9135 RepID=A0A8C9KQD6_SERCA